MSNAASLLAGTDTQLNAWWEAGEATTIGQRGNGVPLLWAIMFDPNDIRLRNVECDGEEMVVYGLRTQPRSAVEHIEARQSAVANLLPVSANLRDWVDIMLEGLRSIRADLIELDVTEIALMTDPQQVVSELRSLLEYLQHPHRFSGAASFLPKRKRVLQSARNCVLYQCNFLDVKRIPSVDEYRSNPSEHGVMAANLIGDFDHFVRENNP